VPLSALLARTELGLRKVAGPEEDVPLHWVHTSEMEDPLPYLLGGELLLTAGVHFESAAGAGTYLDRYVARAVDGGAAALGFGLAPVHDETPRALVAACERYGLPLVEVPPATPFTAVARAVWQAMAEARDRELRRVTEAQQALASAAARPDPVPAVLRRLARTATGWTALVSPGGQELYAAGPAPATEVREAAGRLAGTVRPAPASATDTVDGMQLTAYALAGGAPGDRPVLVVVTGHRDLAGHTIGGVAAVLLSLLTSPHLGTAEAGRSAALVRLLLGAPPEEAASLLGARAPWTVVHALRRGPAAGPLAAAALGTALGTALFDGQADTDTDTGTGTGTVKLLLPAGREVTPQPGWTLGASGPVGAGELPAGDAQAAGALRRAVATRSALALHRGGDTGVAGLVSPGEAREHARGTLAPVADSAALVATLRTWLALHGSWDRTAVALQVHRNTVRQRIARAAALLDMDLDDPDTRMELWFALRWI
jgi:hypothetical protein